MAERRSSCQFLRVVFLLTLLSCFECCREGTGSLSPLFGVIVCRGSMILIFFFSFFFILLLQTCVDYLCLCIFIRECSRLFKSRFVIEWACKLASLFVPHSRLCNLQTERVTRINNYQQSHYIPMNCLASTLHSLCLRIQHLRPQWRLVITSYLKSREVETLTIGIKCWTWS